MLTAAVALVAVALATRGALADEGGAASLTAQTWEETKVDGRVHFVKVRRRRTLWIRARACLPACTAAALRAARRAYYRGLQG